MCYIIVLYYIVVLLGYIIVLYYPKMQVTLSKLNKLIYTFETSKREKSQNKNNKVKLTVYCTHFLGPFKIFEERLLASSCPSVRLSAWNNSANTGRIFTKFDISLLIENLSRNFHVLLTVHLSI